MRNCQICNNNGKKVIQSNYGGSELALFECTSCRHRYVDGLVDQAWFDDYYLRRYSTDDKPYSDARLNSLAEFCASFKPLSVLDIGGMDGELQTRLQDRNVSCYVSGVGDIDLPGFEVVVLSHTLEHIYDMGAMFERIHKALVSEGVLIIEVPIHLGYQDPAAYDNHWQHINKFRVSDLERLLTQKGFVVEVSESLPDYREYNCWRIVGRK